ncbi:RNA polymerase sigma factor [Snuella lapsa]|uniref:RNA polymerase sigma factor YlaC n=1 Tax=Snuella lapsa TaxID=870481 RepID=A0ABP6YKG9_9FLAO
MRKELHTKICEEKVFESIYNTYSKDLTDYLYYRYGEALNPKDKAQEAFVKLWNNCKKVSVDKAKSYLFTVANNMMLNAIKHQKVVLKYQTDKPNIYHSESPEFILEKKQYFEKYKAVLASLNDEQRVAFLLNKVEGKKHGEIAEILGVTQKVVEYRIYSAFNILKKELEGFKIK